tara:strand:+ start:525 stop:716 length:192 start_codon:yes stop_codon:yes gene_type:complete
MENKVCGNCGSFYLISDRSLGGKIICTKCGSSFIKTRTILGNNNKLWFFFLLIIVLFLIIIFK